MIDAARLLADLQPQLRKLDTDLRQQIKDEAELKARLEAEYAQAKQQARTASTFNNWLDGEITQAAVAWLLSCVFLRFCEDNALIDEPLLAAPGNAQFAVNVLPREAQRAHVRAHPLSNERDWLLHGFAELAKAPAVAGLFDKSHNPLYRLPISAYAAKDLIDFWQAVDPATGALRHDFTDPERDTRFLGDLYQDLSEAARKRYALLQTPDFVEEFILDRTLTPAIDTFGVDVVRMIDPTCGSGHFLLGAFQRLLGIHRDQGVEPREAVKRALAAVHGVDLNPFAVAIARFRLLVAALQAAGIRRLREAPGWTFNLTTGDALLHGPRLADDLGLDGEEQLSGRFGHAFVSEDIDAINRILGQRYHAVVGNPPYITVKDSALNALYRARYASCHRKYSLGVPFTERFIQLALSGTGTQQAGFVGLITANSFMKREFGKKLIEDYLPRQDLTHVIDTSGAYIPGHGTPTVILFARHRSPVAGTVRAVLGIRGEPSTPADPSQGLVWTSITSLIDQPGTENDFISATDVARNGLTAHPWSLSGGAAPEILSAIDGASNERLGAIATDIGFGAILGEDDAFILGNTRADKRRTTGLQMRPLVIGDGVRDWIQSDATEVLFPYNENIDLLGELEVESAFWPLRCYLWARAVFGGKTFREAGRGYWEYHQMPIERCRIPLSITFAEVATHNHFVLDRGGKVFKQTAPVIKLPAGTDENTHLGLLGLLNSSTANFWVWQVVFPKDRSPEIWQTRLQRAGTRLLDFPLPDARPIAIARQLDQLAISLTSNSPSALARQFPLSRTELDSAGEHAASLRGKMIAWQEELDWWCYRAYGLFDEPLCYSGEPPEVNLGERAFEIVLARQLEAGESDTSWFRRHGSTPRTSLPEHWPADYAALVQRRIQAIEDHPWIRLLEKPEYKRRWNQPSWEELEQAALRGWLLDRLETPAYWPEPPTLLTIETLARRAERDADFMAVATLYTGEQGFTVDPLIQDLIADESVPAVKAMRYKEPGLRKRADWERTWELQRQEDAIDAQVAADNPRGDDESEADWQARIKPLCDTAKREAIGDIPVPPKYKATDFASTTIKRLRGDLDVPKERFFTLPNADDPNQSFIGWAGFTPVQRVQAIAGLYTSLETEKGWPLTGLIPLLTAVAEQLPWVLQWHNALDPDHGVRLGDYFSEWLGSERQKHDLTREALEAWRPPRATRGRRRRAS